MSELWKVPDEFKDLKGQVMLKVLQGRYGLNPPYVGMGFRYPPPRRRGSKWTYGEWTTPVQSPVKCKRGYHLTLEPHLWSGDSAGNRLWWAEGLGVGERNEDDSDSRHKEVFRTARLLRPVTLADLKEAGDVGLRSVVSVMGATALRMVLAACTLAKLKAGDYQEELKKAEYQKVLPEFVTLLKVLRSGAVFSEEQKELAHGCFRMCPVSHVLEGAWNIHLGHEPMPLVVLVQFSAECDGLNLHTAKLEWRRGKIRPKGV